MREFSSRVLRLNTPDSFPEVLHTIDYNNNKVVF